MSSVDRAERDAAAALVAGLGEALRILGEAGETDSPWFDCFQRTKRVTEGMFSLNLRPVDAREAVAEVRRAHLRLV